MTVPPSLPRPLPADLIPHAGPMSLLDEVLDWGETWVECRSDSHRRPRHPLARNGRLAAVCAVEYGAQAAAVHGGLLSRRQGGPPQAGFIAAIKNIDLGVERLDTIEEPLLVRAECLLDLGHNRIFSFLVRTAEHPLVSGRITIMQVPRQEQEE